MNWCCRIVFFGFMISSTLPMNLLKKYLVLVALLIVGSANTMNFDVKYQSSALGSSLQAEETVQASSPEVKEFERLIQEVFKSEKSSTAKRVAVGALRELVKLGTIATTAIVSSKMDDSNSAWIKISGRVLFCVICILLPILSDLFIHKKDQSLASLQKLQKYIASLRPEQNENIKILFKTKYANMLKEKILQENDSTGIKIGRGVMAALDSLLPLFALGVVTIEIIDKNPTISEKIIDGAVIGSSVLLDALAIAYSALNSTDHKKRRIMKKINAALNSPYPDFIL